MKVSRRSHCTSVSFGKMEQLLATDSFGSTTSCPFVLPFWMHLWKKMFAIEFQTCLVMVASEEEPIGIAPLKRGGDTVSFMGHEDLFDYQDVIVRPGNEETFFVALLRYLGAEGVKRLELGALRPDSTVLQFLPSILRGGEYRVSQTEAGWLYTMGLPATWEDYLELLDGKQRHELRRKFRRFRDAGTLRYVDAADGEALRQWLAQFFDMFQASREEKAAFLNLPMRRYFEELAEQLTRRGMLRPATLLLNGKAVAVTFGFVAHKTYYLYNSGYLPEFSKLSPGLLCKAMSIHKSMENGMAAYNFLKGMESYKKHLGGDAIQLVRLTIELDSGGR